MTNLTIQALESIIEQYRLNPQKLESYGIGGGSSHETYYVNFADRKYKVRNCRSIIKSRQIEQWVRYLHTTPFQKYLIPFYGRIDNVLVFKIIEGKELIPNPEPELIKQLGNAIRILHNVLIPNWANVPTLESYREDFINNLKVICREYMDTKSLEQKYIDFEPCTFNVVCEYNNIVHHNFIVSYDNELKFVDNEDWNVEHPFRALIRPFNFWLSAKQKNAFLEGLQINRNEDNSIIKFIELNYLVKWLVRRIQLQKGDSPDIIRRLDEIVSGNAKPLF